MVRFDMEKKKKLYKATELAEILGIAKETVYRLGREGKIDRIQVGRSVRFFMPESDAEKRRSE